MKGIVLNQGNNVSGHHGSDDPRPLRVLLAEDNSVNERLATVLLHRLQCTVDVARNGREAVALFEQAAYDCILMDCQMPEMDGYDATRAIREIEARGARPRTPIVAVTANALSGDRERCLEAGMDDHVAKPINAAAIARALEQWARPVRSVA